MKKLLVSGVASLASVLVVLLLLEIVLRLLPVAEVTRTLPFEFDGKPLYVAANPDSEFDFSQNFNFYNSRTRKSNNFGFFTNYEFIDTNAANLVIGDSYVEALHVDFDETFHQIVAKERYVDFYPIGISDSPLPQYEAYLAQACEIFNFRKVVFLIIGNDFDESLYESRSRDGFSITTISKEMFS